MTSRWILSKSWTMGWWKSTVSSSKKTEEKWKRMYCCLLLSEETSTLDPWGMEKETDQRSLLEALASFQNVALPQFLMTAKDYVLRSVDTLPYWPSDVVDNAWWEEKKWKIKNFDKNLQRSFGGDFNFRVVWYGEADWSMRNRKKVIEDGLGQELSRELLWSLKSLLRVIAMSKQERRWKWKTCQELDLQEARWNTF